MVDLLFVTLLVLTAYPYLGYPALLYVVTRRRPDPVPPPLGDPPTVTFLVSAYNEEEVIAETVRNLQRLEYPRSRFRAIIGSDGSADNTVSAARQALDPQSPVEIVEFAHRRGKTAVLRALLAGVDTDIVALCDANTSLEATALQRLVRWFADPRVGCVCGRLELVSVADAGRAERFYWSFETWLKRRENRLAAVLGANGGLYAFRQSVHQLPDEDVITDDFVLPMLIRQKGYRIIFDETAVAREETAATVEHEFTRRKRIGAGNLQALRLTRSLLGVRAGWTAVAYWSHKVARWAAPLFLSAAVVVALTQAGRTTYQWIVWAGAVIFAGAGIGWLIERLGRRPPAAVALPYAFVAMNTALLIGATRFLRGHRDSRWVRTPRTSATSSSPAGEGHPPSPPGGSAASEE